MGLATEPSIFIVGDRKQSIYRFRDAEVAVMQEAARFIEGLRPAGNPRHSIRRSFRALPELLAFVNDLFTEISQPSTRPDDFTYTRRSIPIGCRLGFDAGSFSEWLRRGARTVCRRGCQRDRQNHR
jgi:superfamily I DNA/RNA helicase